MSRPETQDLILMAAAVDGLRPHAALTANCDRVVATVMRWVGVPLTLPDVRGDAILDHPLARECYAALIAMTRHRPAADTLLEGAGNFGTPAEPVALPAYTACRLTLRGEAIADELLARHPEYSDTLS